MEGKEMLKIGILVFDKVEELDFIGPFEVLNYINKLCPQSTDVKLIAEQCGMLKAFNGLNFYVPLSIDEVKQLDILIIPGGQGRTAAMHNPALLDFIKRIFPDLKYLATVCTGALIAASCGILQNLAATTYHTALAELAKYDRVQVIHGKKIVDSGKIITAAGVSSGLELGLYLLQKCFGKQSAKAVAQRIEYTPDLDVYLFNSSRS